jgi:murein DD-endopeptidase MepM/ murein hydrolase activator NlpD
MAMRFTARPRAARRRAPRTVAASWLLVAVLPLSVLCMSGASATTPAPSRIRYGWPILGAISVERGFDAGAGTYGAGHRGLDVATAPDQVVLASAAGTVSYAGTVAGRGVIVIDHPDGIRTTYEPVTPLVNRGQIVRLDQPIGVISGVHGDFALGTVLHWGARRGDFYLDPASLLRPLGPVRLVPI